jgi:phosphopantothenoylcysteine decarboxylase/phosphopantothenate--cysteine ligase
MTESATHFISPLTLSSLSKHPVALSMFPNAGTEPASGSWHIDWALWADAMVIAPASAATIAKLAVGLTDNALTVIATALRGKLFVAPAMDTDMYEYPAVAANLARLRAFGIEVIPPGEGELASGLVGVGRLAEPADIVAAIERHLRRRESLKGKHVVVTAGPTHEPIDPVRYIANYSSGKMGYALAAEARDRGARVTLVSGPTSLEAPHGVELVNVTTADEMANAVDAVSDAADIIIAAAAVADFAPTDVPLQKLKRREMTDEEMSVKLRPTRDILRTLGERKTPRQVLVGFALETSSLVESARAKLHEKNCDLIVANSANERGAGFASDTNKVTLVAHDDEVALPMMPKSACAAAIFDAIERLIDVDRQRIGITERQHG